ncbi:hypothetical protein [Streptomyces syringium]|uniref:hypothetical protein n=1 Tax=Streptomyces syringium TaxID=76729 RepID=UPI0037D2E35C
MNQPVHLPEPRPIEWPPPSPVEVLRRARTAADEILAAAEAEAAKLRTESASLRAEVETAASEAERRRQQAVDERGRVTALLDEEVAAGRQAVRLSQERAALLTEEADELLARARQEADRLISEAQETARAAEAEKAKLTAAREEVQERAAGITAEAVARGKAEADQYLAAARKEAARTTYEAETVAKGLLRSASAEAQETKDAAQRFREELGERASTKAKRDKQIDDWSPRVALTAVVGLTASGEFQLAQLAGWPTGIAWMLPLGIDVYVVQAMRRHRDVAPALILMVAANAIYHLAAVGLFGAHLNSHGVPAPEWWLIVGVAAIAPFVMWRIHRITAPATERKPRGRQRRESAAPAGESTVEVARERSHESDGESSGESTDESSQALSRRPALPPGESEGAARASADESGRESAPESSHESGGRARSRAASKARAGRERARRGGRQKVSPIGDIDLEVAKLVALMEERGDADAVTLTDAEKITGRSSATAARRLSAARSKYRKPA